MSKRIRSSTKCSRLRRQERRSQTTKTLSSKSVYLIASIASLDIRWKGSEWWLYEVPPSSLRRRSRNEERLLWSERRRRRVWRRRHDEIQFELNDMRVRSSWGFIISLVKFMISGVRYPKDDKRFWSPNSERSWNQSRWGSAKKDWQSLWRQSRRWRSIKEFFDRILSPRRERLDERDILA